MAKKTSFVKSVKQEIEKVKWPSGKNMVKYTFATLGSIIFFGAYFYLITALFALLKGLFA